MRPATAQRDPSDATQTGFAKIGRRVVPIALGLYIISYLDRVNIGFAAPTMSKDLGFGPEIFGLAAGLFFVTYALLEIPSTMAAQRFGTRVWLARIMITWGILAGLTGFVHNETQLYVVRLLLGAAEAGAFPILLLWLSSWIPRESRARALALFVASLPLAAALGAPLSGFLLSLDGLFGLEGWRLLFIIEAIPAVIAGVWVFLRLPERPSRVSWLTPAEKEAVTAVLAQQDRELAGHRLAASTVKAAFQSGRVWATGIVFLGISLGFYSLTLWQPMLLAESFSGLTQWELGWVNAVPFVLAIGAMYLVGRYCDRRGASRGIVLVLAALTAIAIVLIGLMGGIGYVALIVATMAIWSIAGVAWITPSRFLQGRAAASGVPLINSINALGGFIGPFTVGVLIAGGSGLAALAFVAAAVLLGGLGYFVIASRVE
jgi:ACS family tartrate transporter-like MFS transporter